MESLNADPLNVPNDRTMKICVDGLFKKQAKVSGFDKK